MMNIIFFLRNSGCEKERVAEDMPISEVRKCSRLATPVNSLIALCGGYMLSPFNSSCFM